MQRTVSSSLTADVLSPVDLELQVAVARADGLDVDERLEVTLDGAPLQPTELDDPGPSTPSRVHVLRCGPGRLEVRYDARVTGRAAPTPVTGLDATVFRRPSRYGDSDRLAALAVAQLGPGVREDGEGEDPAVVRDRVVAFVRERIAYVSGSSRGTDSAVDSLLMGAGVCRDHAHLVVALLRALGVPARLVSVYAPGLAPMDFHAVTEVLVGERWTLVDSTGLAPRPAMVRIATGRDAADTAFLTTYGGELRLTGMTVLAVVDGDLPVDPTSDDVYLG
ncbi:transglutaminase-like domain-containing protein [Aquipuribacter sp. SD81]|uniref:transglutaminase-like domain-containing protein n=1 Tax=Aquipuribacter sp. SD81 TaxID=3127703 RepID=UPI00301A74F1